MSACIYHDAEAAAICPSCDFGVCATCMDLGSEGVCSTCSEERDMRRQHSALQREYTVEEQVARCNYCRAQADEETPLDGQGYCPTCSTLARCSLHDDLIAVGHCKSCRKEYCRKCLGFTDVCQSCTAKNKTRPTKAAPPSVSSKPSKKKGTGTGPMKESAARAKDGPSGRKKGGTEPLRGGERGSRGKGTTELDENGKKKKRPPSRGTLVMEQKLASKAPSRRSLQILAASVAGALVCILMLSGAFLHASAPEEQARKMQEQMLTVHKAVMLYYKQNGTLPGNPDQIYGAMGSLRVKNPKKIHVGILRGNDKGPFGPNTVLFMQIGGKGFQVAASDSKGKVIMDPNGAMVALDQSYDSSSKP